MCVFANGCSKFESSEYFAAFAAPRIGPLELNSHLPLPARRLGTIDYLAPEILDCPVKQLPTDNKQNPSIGWVAALTGKLSCMG